MATAKNAGNLSTKKVGGPAPQATASQASTTSKTQKTPMKAATVPADQEKKVTRSQAVAPPKAAAKPQQKPQPVQQKPKVDESNLRRSSRLQPAAEQSKASSQSNKRSESPVKSDSRLRQTRATAKPDEARRNTRSSRSLLVDELPYSSRETRQSLRLQSKASLKKPKYIAESSEEESYHKNPLTRGRRRHEALTEIVENDKDKMTDGMGGTHGFSDDEKELAIELEKEKAKKEKKIEIYDD